MSPDLQDAVEGLRKIAVVFAAADKIASTLETFDQAEASAATWLKKAQAEKAECDSLQNVITRLRVEHDDEIARINADAFAQRDVISEGVAKLQHRQAELEEQIAAAEAHLVEINAKIAAAEKQRQRLLDSLK